MPYCPDCLTEYVDGVAECADCGVALLPGSPPERPRQQLEDVADSKLVRIRVFSGGTAQLDADLARNILETEGIPCVLPGETSAEILPVLDVPLFVRAKDAERAAELLKSYLDEGEPLPSE
jgi:hypothetical protein